MEIDRLSNNVVTVHSRKRPSAVKDWPQEVAIEMFMYWD